MFRDLRAEILADFEEYSTADENVSVSAYVALRRSKAAEYLAEQRKLYPAKHRAYSKAYRARRNADPERYQAFLAKKRWREKRWRAKNKEKVIGYRKHDTIVAKAKRHAQRGTEAGRKAQDKRNARARAWRHKNPEKYKARLRRQRDAKRAKRNLQNPRRDD